jgi:hypothetical protein
MIEVVPPMGKYKYNAWRIHSVKCYIDNSVHLGSCIRNVNNHQDGSQAFGAHEPEWSPTLAQSRIDSKPYYRDDSWPECH